MGISPKNRQIVWAKSGACCAFSKCHKRLVLEEKGKGKDVLVGEVAHIVAEPINGPRGDKQPPGGDRNGYQNLILLCKEHHKLIDDRSQSYPVEKLLLLKSDHEKWVAETLSTEQRYIGLEPEQNVVRETFYSSLMPLTHFPRVIYLAPCELDEETARQQIVNPFYEGIILPFVIRSNNLISFNNLTDENTPFCKSIDPYSAEKHYVNDWLIDPDYSRWVLTLLNRSLNKITGRKGLLLDKDHRRYYFPLAENNGDRAVVYNSLSGRRQSRKVAWKPITKITGEPKRYYEHMAVSLQFHHANEQSWFFSIRPERRFTNDGVVSIHSDKVGSRSTRKKARMYNIDFLTEVHFWRDYLFDGKPRLILNFGDNKNSLAIENELLRSEISWPKVTEDRSNLLTIQYHDDLFSLADLNEISGFEDEDDIWLTTEGDDGHE